MIVLLLLAPYTAPPSSGAWLLLMITWLRVNWPLLKMEPPLPSPGLPLVR